MRGTEHGQVIELVGRRDTELRARYSALEARVHAVLPDAGIEHIGSTSVPGFVAKDVVDVLVGVRSGEIAEAADALRDDGMDLEGIRAGHAWLSLPSHSARDAVVHVVERGGAQWRDRVDFRDLLTTSADARASYLAIKRQLAEETTSWGSYTARKAPIVRALLARARLTASLDGMTSADQQDIDARIQTYYGEVFDEHVRLTTRSAQGPLEFQRTQEIIRSHVPGGRVLDIGGGAGIHSRALMDAGYEMEMIDPVVRHVEQAQEAGVRASVGDARELEHADQSFDAAILLGPLYHLASREDRLRALREAARVVRAGGVVLAAGLSRYVAFGAASLGRPVPTPFPGEWAALIADGTPGSQLRFPAGHFHTAEELEDEVADAGMDVLEVVGVEGPAGLLLESVADVHPDVREAALTVARAASAVPGIPDQSAHLIAVARVR
ncbi:GrpB family protein [Microbacterium arabinogalactanolyticum]|uniref:GrpB family protein n=1 Tax=Microbacterium arabinogalactanolyticum TaxID=69365 RepID=UPI004043D69C